MKKERKKLHVKRLQLNREALRQLDLREDGDLLKVAGGMPMSPVSHCGLSLNGC
ncbi:MAG TPA: hypothetical protein VF173_33415 [Thermoanaerobaculia bacterium]|nr:hypothetical protein [Thermoanaerobaculia bacterium]